MEVHWQAYEYHDRCILPHLPSTDCQLCLEAPHSHHHQGYHPSNFVNLFPVLVAITPKQQLLGFMLCLGAFLTSTNYVTGVQVVVPHSWNIMVNGLSFVNDAIHHAVMLLTDSAIFGKIASLLAAHDVNGLWI